MIEAVIEFWEPGKTANYLELRIILFNEMEDMNEMNKI